jgi:hypothetical protein
MLGHASLEMTRRYCELADIDVKRAHATASPVDNLELRIRQQHERGRRDDKHQGLASHAQNISRQSMS